MNMNVRFKKHTSLKFSPPIIIVYSRDHKGVGVAHEIISPRTQPQPPPPPNDDEAVLG